MIWTLSLALFAVLAMPAASTQAQAPTTRFSPVDPLPPDTGTAGLKQMLLRLQTTARLMQTVAHPDDEDGGMLTLESRGKGVTTLLMTLTRGEGGQNKVGSNLNQLMRAINSGAPIAANECHAVLTDVRAAVVRILDIVGRKTSL